MLFRSSDLSLGETDDAIVNEHDNVADTPANVEVNKPADDFSANDNEHLVYKHQYSSKEEQILLQALLSRTNQDSLRATRKRKWDGLAETPGLKDRDMRSIKVKVPKLLNKTASELNLTDEQLQKLRRWFSQKK